MKSGFSTVSVSVTLRVTPPPLPFSVTVAVPAFALVAAYNFIVVLPLPGEGTVEGANAAVTPAGNPLTEKLMGDLKPAAIALVTVKDALPPAAMLIFVTLGFNAKVGTAIVTLTAVDRLNPPPVPVILTFHVPAPALVAAMNVTTTGVDGLIVVVENFTVTPGGAPAVLNFAGTLKPLLIRVSVVLAAPPGVSEMLLTLGKSAKPDSFESLQWFTSSAASMDPSPVASS